MILLCGREVNKKLVFVNESSSFSKIFLYGGGDRFPERCSIYEPEEGGLCSLDGRRTGRGVQEGQLSEPLAGLNFPFHRAINLNI